jgi:hypothetical protein
MDLGCQTPMFLPFFLEWTLVCVSYNLKRLVTFKNLATAA